MSTAFDTLKLADRLQSSGFTAEQARGTSSALSEALTADLVTKVDLSQVRQELKAEIADVKAEVTGVKGRVTGVKAELLILKWMIGFVLALVTAVFVKVFVH